MSDIKERREEFRQDERPKRLQPSGRYVTAEEIHAAKGGSQEIKGRIIVDQTTKQLVKSGGGVYEPWKSVQSPEFYDHFGATKQDH